MAKKILSVFLAVVMVLSTMTVAFADDAQALPTATVAKIGDVCFSSLQEAIEAAVADDEIELVCSIAESDITVDADDDVVIDLGGNTVTGDFMVYGKATIKNGSIINTSFVSGIEANGQDAYLTVEDLTIASDRHALRLDGCNATINSGTYTTTQTGGSSCYAVNVKGDKYPTTVVINGGIFNGQNSPAASSGCALMIQQSKEAVTINGGTFNGGYKTSVESYGNLTIKDGIFNGPTITTEKTDAITSISGGAFSDEPKASDIVDGKAATLTRDGYYTVVDVVAKIVGGNGYGSIADAVRAANPNDTIEVLPGTHDLIRDMVNYYEGQTGWYLPIAQDGITLKGIADANGKKPVITSTEDSANGAWASQNLITVFGKNVTIDNFDIITKVDANKVIEVVGENFTLKDCEIKANAKFNEYAGSVYFRGVKTGTIDNCVLNNAPIFCPNDAAINLINVTVNADENYAKAWGSVWNLISVGGDKKFVVDGLSFNIDKDVDLFDGLLLGTIDRAPLAADIYTVADGVANKVVVGEDNVEIGKSTADFTAAAAGVEVEIPALLKEAAETADVQAHYTPVVEVISEEKTTIGEAEGVKVTADISIVKTVNTVEEEIQIADAANPVDVTVTIPQAANADVTVEKDSSVLATVKADAKGTFTFAAASFSPFYFSYVPVASSVDSADKAEVVFVETAADDESTTYNIVLKSTEAEPLTRVTSAEMNITMTNTTGFDVDYKVLKSGAFDISTSSAGKYLFNLPEGSEALLNSQTGDVVLGKVVVSGYTYKPYETAQYAKIEASDLKAQYKGLKDGIKYDIDVTAVTPLEYAKKVATKELTVNISFPNNIQGNAKDYQDMTVTISGGNEKYTYNLGDADVKNDTFDYDVAFDAANNMYVLSNADLTKNTTYTVTVSGAGYRTATYSVRMTENKTLNFWNNVKDRVEVIEVGADPVTAVFTNFLAGDIVKDNNINIYDLSAVVSYFGEASTVANKYAKYDLNRDGVIDSKDVALVLVSWNDQAKVKPVVVAAPSQTELNDALKDATEPTIVKLPEGTFTLPTISSAQAPTQKDVTFTGTKDTVVDLSKPVNTADSIITFEGVTVKFDNDGYEGLQHSAKVVYKNCTIIGTQFLYAPEAEFINCTFEVENGYNIWTYGAKKVTFTNCTFKTQGRSIFVYNEEKTSSFVADIILNNCTFYDDGTYVGDKAAVETGSNANNTATSNKYNLKFNNCVVNGFEANNSTSPLWGNKNSMDKDHLNVIINGVDVY